MSTLTTWFGWRVNATDEEMPEIFPIPITQSIFVQTDVINIYSKILTDVLERCQGLNDDQAALLWDNCLKSESSEGLVTMLAKAMSDKKDLFLVYQKDVGLIRKATIAEEAQIRSDYERSASSTVGVYVSFKQYTRSDMVKLYSGLEYCTVAALNKSMNLSKAIQFKMSDLRASTSLTDSSEVKSQAKLIATGLANGKDVLLDAKDVIETNSPDLTSVKESILFLNQKRAFYLGMPEAYINGIQTGGLGSTGEQDTKATERGLKNYYFSIVKPVIEAVFGIKLSYKSQDFRQIAQGFEALKTFELISEDLITLENKQKIVAQLFDFEFEPIEPADEPEPMINTPQDPNAMGSDEDQE
jgi:hypothetical protein